eukprot:CAMPEP_0202685116 /NCGR_PEP_ID=MMETSP1385-20130828/795_1 /ASSEMBLY_ACC=CAM_ASM_000861 /TAXON_ID=933848 /ORGANISM="Elphidium margaritaceum" /LENGTH=217 /DNA_ID=CAMNT_0049339379 /DNA_START=53 /DNA_END=706 /DNA_ORIENTATION=+
MNTKVAQKLSAVIKSGVLSDDNIARIHRIAQHKIEHDEDANAKQIRADGHSVTFLQKNGLFESMAPKLLSNIIETMKKADDENWQLIESVLEGEETTNYRVIEYHHYVKGGGLLNKHHFDGGSILTAVMMLSDPDKDFAGGKLMTWESNETFKVYEVQKGDMLIFPSHKYHSVDTVTKGQRYVLVIEIWNGPKGNDNFRTGGFAHLLPSLGCNDNVF